MNQSAALPEVMNFEFNRFYRYDELTDALQRLQSRYPQLVSLQSIGKSHEGRDIWVMTVTNRLSGPAEQKPAFWVDGNIHSIEVSASAAALYLLDYLVKGYGVEADVTRVLDDRAFYVCPRVNPDGAEWALAASPRFVRSSTRDYPRTYPELEAPQEGFEVKDIDGDGKILRMRIPDKHGHWKCHPDDARVMIRRDPAETGGQYYQILPEGAFVNADRFDGTRIKVNLPQQGLDLNRNFPENWRQEFQQLGAGDYPTSEPEVKAIVDWFITHPNISGGVAFHTFSGVLLRPFGGQPDTSMAPEDLRVFKRIGKEGTDLTGYPNIGVFEEFRYATNDVITGTFDWAYDNLGLYSWVVELWSPMREAGIEKYDFIDWFIDHPAADDIKMIHWNDTQLKGKAFVPWRAFTHPELGQVELGGWDSFSFISNVPGDLLEKEIAKFPKWLIWQALISPKLELRSATCQALGANLFKVRLEVSNVGWLPTYISKRALERKVCGVLKAEITLPFDAKLIGSSTHLNASFGALPIVDLGQLDGWSHKGASGWFWPDAGPTSHIGVAEWIVQVQASCPITLKAYHPKAGSVTTELSLSCTGVQS
jgi:murein tripeptide amidase MpaA